MKFNHSPEWAKVVAKYDPIIKAITAKYSKPRHGVNDDIRQECLIALYSFELSKVKGYSAEIDGPVTADNIPRIVDAYVRQCIRNAVLTELQSVSRGPWWTASSRYVSIPELNDMGFDIGEDRELSTKRDGDASVY